MDEDTYVKREKNIIVEGSKVSPPWGRYRAIYVAIAGFSMYQVLYYRRSNLPGSMMMLFSKPKTPSTAIPSNLNGRVSSQKTGYNTKAKIASGQQSIKRMIQAINVNIG